MQQAEALRPIDEGKVRKDILAQGYTILHDVVPADTITAIRNHWLNVYASDSEKRPVIWGPYYGEVNRVVWDSAPRLQSGSILVFDAFFNMPNWRNNEYRAFVEFVEACNVKFSFICWAYQQVAVRIDAIDAPAVSD